MQLTSKKQKCLVVNGHLVAFTLFKFFIGLDEHNFEYNIVNVYVPISFNNLFWLRNKKKKTFFVTPD